jgi:hypothetical protein
MDASWFVAQNVGLLYEGKASDPYCPRQLSCVSGQHAGGSARACSYLYRRSRSPHRRGHLGNAIADRCVQCIEYSFEVMFIYSNQVKKPSVQAKSNRKHLCLIEIALGAAEAKYKNKMLVTAPVHDMTKNGPKSEERGHQAPPRTAHTARKHTLKIDQYIPLLDLGGARRGRNG